MRDAVDCNVYLLALCEGNRCQAARRSDVPVASGSSGVLPRRPPMDRVARIRLAGNGAVRRTTAPSR